MRRASSVFLLALAAAGCSSMGGHADLGRPELVMVEGWAADDPRDPVGSRSRALDDARREAVSQAVRVYVPARTLAEQSEVVTRDILSKTSRYVVREDVSGERREGSFLKLRLRAAVLFSLVAEDLKTRGLITAGIEAPAQKLGLAAPDPQVRDVLLRVLGEHGFKAAAVSSSSFVSEDAPGDLAQAAAWGKAAGLEAVAAARSSAVTSGEKMGNLHSFRARVEIVVTDAREGRRLGAAFQEASGLGADPAIARGKALDAAAQGAGEEIASLLPRLLPPGGVIQLKIYGLSGPEELRHFEEDLRAMPKVREVVLKDYLKGNGWLVVRSDRLTPEELAAEALRLPGFALELRGVLPDEVELIRREKL